jgi:hypothetical protein
VSSVESESVADNEEIIGEDVNLDRLAAEVRQGKYSTVWYGMVQSQQCGAIEYRTTPYSTVQDST